MVQRGQTKVTVEEAPVGPLVLMVTEVSMEEEAQVTTPATMGLVVTVEEEASVSSGEPDVHSRAHSQRTSPLLERLCSS